MCASNEVPTLQQTKKMIHLFSSYLIHPQVQATHHENGQVAQQKKKDYGLRR